MLQDEATWALFEKLAHDGQAELRVTVEDGEYRAAYATGGTTVEGAWRPVLSDALVSLLEALVDQAIA